MVSLSTELLTCKLSLVRHLSCHMQKEKEFKIPPHIPAILEEYVMFLPIVSHHECCAGMKSIVKRILKVIP